MAVSCTQVGAGGAGGGVAAAHRRDGPGGPAGVAGGTYRPNSLQLHERDLFAGACGCEKRAGTLLCTHETVYKRRVFFQSLD